MDPNAALEEIRSLIIRWHETGGNADDGDRFYELVEGLDKWCSRGGFKPVAWTNSKEEFLNPVSGRLERLEALDDVFAYLGHTHPSTKKERDRIRNVLAAHPDAEGLVIFQCLQLDSSNAGRLTTVVVGPSCEGAKSIEEASQKHLYDLPSQRQYPRAYYRIGA